MKLFLSLILSLLFSLATQAQSVAEIKMKILENDKEFWLGYNTCDTKKIDPFLDADIEFYHDKGGITLGNKNLLESIKKNLCADTNFRIRRELVENSLQFFPLTKNGEIYGAILTGEHVFYITQGNQKEQLDGRANFSHLWIQKNGIWKMTRIFSYNHRSAN